MADACCEADHLFEERVRAECERRLASIPAMLQSVDETGRLISVSDAWLAKLGYAREEVLDRPFLEFLAPEARECAINAPQPEYFRLSRCENVRYRMARKDGGVIDVLLSAQRVDGSRSSGGISFAVLTDVTPLLEAKRFARENQAFYRALVEEQTDLVALTSLDGELRYVNKAYASFCGLRPDQMIGKSLYEFVPSEEHPALAEHFRRVLATRECIEVENRVLLPTGEPRWFAWTNRALTDSEGRLAAIHSSGRDVQRRVDAERRLQASEARYRFLAENSTDLILMVDREGTRLYVSPACRQLLGYEPEEAMAIRLRDTIHPDDAERVFAALAASPESDPLTYRVRHKDGRYVWVETTGKTVQLGENESHRIVIVRDIEQRVTAEQRLKASEARYRLLAENGTDMVYQLDRDLVQRYVSPACREILGYEPEELIGSKPVDMAHPEDAPRLELTYETLMSGRSDRLSLVKRSRHRDGRWIWVEEELRGLREAETGPCVGIIGAARDISARKAIEDELAHANRRLKMLAGQDALTGLANRRAFDEALESELRRARRDRGGVALIIADVDHFKAFNDRYGHPAGDACLKRIAEAISGAVRFGPDVVARYGGEEFVVVMPETNLAEAHAVAIRIRHAVSSLAIAHEGSETGVVTISAGVAAVRPALREETADALVREADRALYLAKKHGRNAVVLASESEVALASQPPAAA